MYKQRTRTRFVLMTAIALLVASMITLAACAESGTDDKGGSNSSGSSTTQSSEGSTVSDFDMQTCSVAVADDWEADSYSDTHATLMSELYGNGYIVIECSKNTDGAEEWVGTLNDNYSTVGTTELDEIEINGTNYYRLTDSDTQFTLVADGSTKGDLVRITVMLLTMDEAKGQLDGITVK